MNSKRCFGKLNSTLPNYNPESLCRSSLFDFDISTSPFSFFNPQSQKIGSPYPPKQCPSPSPSSRPSQFSFISHRTTELIANPKRIKKSSLPIYSPPLCAAVSGPRQIESTERLLMASEKVCVTGAGGYLASWLVKLLLSRNYVVHGTVRANEKYDHLHKLEKASENLKLFEADLLDYHSIYSAIAGCFGVFHVANPVPSTFVPSPEVVIEPTVRGTQNVLKACVETKIRRVVVVSSSGAIMINPSWPKGQVKDETCWSDKEHCRTTKNWYSFSKTEAESEALEYGKKYGLDVVSICPTTIWGPLLQSTVNASSEILINLLKEGYESLKNRVRMIVDVRDVAEALILVYEKPEAEGRYICMGYVITEQDLVKKLKSIYPNYNYPKNFSELNHEEPLSSEKLQKLGWSYRPLEETLIDSVENYRMTGLIN